MPRSDDVDQKHSSSTESDDWRAVEFGTLALGALIQYRLATRSAARFEFDADQYASGADQLLCRVSLQCGPITR